MKPYLALAFICIVWGTTYLAMSIGIAHFPPFLFAATRQMSAGTLLFLIVLISGIQYRWTLQNIARQAFAGFLMITLGNGLVSWAMQYIPSGLAALIGSLTPACVVFINQIAEKEFNLNWKIMGGLLAGIMGMAAIFSENLEDLANPDYFWGVMLTFIATLTWAIGTIYSKNFGKHSNPFGNAALQLWFGGLGQLIWSFGTENWTTVTMSSEVFWALSYLIVFGSISAFVAYLYVLQTLPVGLASIYAYINPLVAVFLGWLILNEKLTAMTGVAFILVIIGVFGISNGYSKKEPEKV